MKQVICLHWQENLNRAKNLVSNIDIYEYNSYTGKPSDILSTELSQHVI